MEIKYILIILLSIVSIALVVSIVYNFNQSSNITRAEEFSGKVSSYLSLTQKECPQNSANFSGMSYCLDRLIAKLSEKPVLVEAMFVNYYLSTAQSKGVLIFKNIGTTTFDSSLFRLYLNKEVQDDDGCEKEGKINPDGLCSLNFYKVCSPGDILYVYYDNQVILAKSC
jgi:hypothetical protein